MQPTKYPSSNAANHSAEAFKASHVAVPLRVLGGSSAGVLRSGAPQASAEGGAGLVSFKTTHTPVARTYTQQAIAGDVLVIDPRVQRSARCRKTLLNTARMFSKAMQATKHRHKVAFITLTYARVGDWEAGHIAAFMNHVRNYLARRGVPMCGLRKLEMQKRGAVHYHLMFWLPKGISLPKPDKKGWWPHGTSNCQWLRNGYGYCAKYVSKTENALIPRGARLYAVFGADQVMKRELRWWITPRFVREAFPYAENHDPVRAKGGGWVSRKTGVVVFSEWQYGGIVRIDDPDDGRAMSGIRRRSPWVRVVRTDRRQVERTDHASAVTKMREQELWQSAANALLFETDRVGWLLKNPMGGTIE